ncbi:MAG: sel1 repeat family protein, partial [Rhodospirillales bacterium]|nr:sel1 repeat family protein [Rhodospirillales bacterium]
MLLFVLAGPALGGPFEDGVKAYAKGDYGAPARVILKAANAGHIDAQANLGVLYELGRGLKRNHMLAAAWYRKAAERGQVAAQYNLGLK